MKESHDLRHVVAWFPGVRWTTVLALWTVLAVAWLFPGLDFTYAVPRPLD